MNDETINEMIIKCPACGIEGVAKSIMKELEIPHFGQVMETTLHLPLSTRTLQNMFWK